MEDEPHDSVTNDLLDYSVVEDFIELVGVGFEILGVAIIVVGIAWATYRFANGQYHRDHARPYARYRGDIGLALLLGLEVLVAADIVESLGGEPSFESLGLLAVLIAIRTVLGWTLEVDAEGRFPWQRRSPESPEAEPTDDSAP